MTNHTNRHDQLKQHNNTKKPIQEQNMQEDTETENYIRIIQINLNKSKKAHLDIINKNVSTNYNLMLIQEPYTTTFNAICTPANFRLIFPHQ